MDRFATRREQRGDAHGCGAAAQSSSLFRPFCCAADADAADKGESAGPLALAIAEGIVGQGALAALAS